jgi:hypothetical protein
MESEKAILGLVFFSPDLLNVAIEHGLKTDQFLAPHHEAAYQAMLALHTDGHPIGVQSVFARMSALGTAPRLNPHGGIAYLIHLEMLIVAPDGFTDHIAIVQLAAIERRQEFIRDALRRPIPKDRKQALAQELVELTAAHDALLSAAEGWPDPLPLPDDAGTTPKLTADMLPPALRNWLADVAERMQCPLEFPAVAALVALASLVGRKLYIYPKRHDDWREVCNLWGLIIGSSLFFCVNA